MNKKSKTSDNFTRISNFGLKQQKKNYSSKAIYIVFLIRNKFQQVHGIKYYVHIIECHVVIRQRNRRKKIVSSLDQGKNFL